MRSGPLGGWTSQLELLALLVEEVGLLAADRRREEPFTVPRPQRSDTAASSAPGTPARPQAPAPEPQAPQRMSGHRKMLAAAMERGMVRG
ncbi:hypothetical protein ACWDXD_25110 [Streptomyces sp. NPDC003314]